MDAPRGLEQASLQQCAPVQAVSMAMSPAIIMKFTNNTFTRPYKVFILSASTVDVNGTRARSQKARTRHHHTIGVLWFPAATHGLWGLIASCQCFAVHRTRAHACEPNCSHVMQCPCFRRARVLLCDRRPWCGFTPFTPKHHREECISGDSCSTLMAQFLADCL